VISLNQPLEGVNEMGNLAEEMHCAAYAFLCPINRNETLREHGFCDLPYEQREKILFEHPEWLLNHYFDNSPEGRKISIEDQEDIYIFLMSHPNGSQIRIAFLCPVNRDFTRRELGYSDRELLEHHQSLILHYARSGGAKANAEERKVNLAPRKVKKSFFQVFLEKFKKK
jgi:hypothetical protein